VKRAEGEVDAAGAAWPAETLAAREERVRQMRAHPEAVFLGVEAKERPDFSPERAAGGATGEHRRPVGRGAPLATERPRAA